MGSNQSTTRQRPNALTDYLSRLEVSQGRLAGQSFEVLRWQRRFIRGAFRDGVGRKAATVKRKLRDMVETGRVERSGTGRKADPNMYSIPVPV